MDPLPYLCGVVVVHLVVVVPLVVAALATVVVAAVAVVAAVPAAAAVAAETAGAADLAEETAGASGLPPPPGPAATNLRRESQTATITLELPAARLPQCELHHHLVCAVKTECLGGEQQQEDELRSKTEDQQCSMSSEDRLSLMSCFGWRRLLSRTEEVA